MQFPQRLGPGDQGGGKVRPQRQGLIAGHQGLARPPQQPQRHREIGQGLGIGGPQLQGSFDAGEGQLGLLKGQLGGAEVGEQLRRLTRARQGRLVGLVG